MGSEMCIRDRLEGGAVHLDIVGQVKLPIPEALQNLPNVTFHGGVARETVGTFYMSADMFVFPTFSDGFGLTQLEAQNYRLPILTSSQSGDVVEDEKTGVILDDVKASKIAEHVNGFLDNPQKLSSFSKAINPLGRYTISSLAKRLENIC